MKCAFSTAILVVVCGAAAPAAAQASGNIRGRVRAFDARENPYVQAGMGFPVAGGRLATGFDPATLFPVPEIWVQLYVYETDSVYTIWYTRTNQQGEYSIPWSETFTPTRLRVSVLAKRPNLPAGIATKARPSTMFSIGRRTILLRVSTLDDGAISDRIVNFNIREASDTVSAYLTTREVYAMWSAHGDGVVGGSVRSSMQGVKVVPNAWPDAGGGGAAGLTLTDSTVELTSQTATRSPYTVAHELGHALVWRALRLPMAIIAPTDYSCTFPGRPDANPGWDDFSYECEKAAFHDALANLNAALWMWRRDSTNRMVPRAPNPWGLEGAGTCAEGPDEENRVACNTRALWDVVDTPNDALDNRDLSDVVSVLRSYPWCLCGFDNRCANEGYSWTPPCADADASNWKDFKFNWIQLFGQAAEMDAIEVGNGLTAQTED